MSPPAHPDFTPQLQQLMQAVQLDTFKALSAVAGVSAEQIRNLRRGKVAQMPVATLVRLSRALQRSLPELLVTFAPPAMALELDRPQPEAAAQQVQDLKQEYDRLQAQLEEQKQALWREFQQASLQTLESLILQLPTAAYAAQQNPQAPAVRLLPLLRPIDTLLQEWGIQAIAPVGAEVDYDPQQHQLMDGHAQPGDRVRVRYTGYRQGATLLYRAKVSPV